MRFVLSIATALLLVGSACVPVRRESYVQASNPREVPDYGVTETFADQDYQYKLRVDDVIAVRVASSTPSEFNFFNYENEQQMGNQRYNDPLLSGFEIDPDGTILFPVIGKISIVGLTLNEARNKIQEIVNEYLESPVVDLKLLSFQVTVLGEVEKEGTFVVYNPELTVLDAIGRAGGLSDFADPTKVKIVRDDGDVIKVVYVNVLEETLLTSPYYYLQPNDVVSVASVPSKNFLQYNAKYLTILLSGLTAVGIFFNIFQ